MHFKYYRESLQKRLKFMKKFKPFFFIELIFYEFKNLKFELV